MENWSFDLAPKSLNYLHWFQIYGIFDLRKFQLHNVCYYFTFGTCSASAYRDLLMKLINYILVLKSRPTSKLLSQSPNTRDITSKYTSHLMRYKKNPVTLCSKSGASTACDITDIYVPLIQ